MHSFKQNLTYKFQNAKSPHQKSDTGIFGYLQNCKLIKLGLILLTQTKFDDQIAITDCIFTFEVGQQAFTTIYHHDQTTT